MRRLWPLMSGATDRAFIVPPRVIRAAMLALPLVSMSPATTVAQEAQSLNEGVVVDVTPQSGTPSAGGEATDVQVDESALRYYAQTGRYDRLEGEIRRLRALHPGWSPPDDLFDPQPEFDEKPLWDLLAEGRLDDLAAAINEYRATRPDWAPSDALRREQGLAVARAALQEAVTAGDWSRAVAIGRGTPELIGCVDPQSTWLYAQAQAQAAPQAARETLGELMGDCEDFDVRLATLQKAADLLPWNDVLALRAVEAEAREHSPTETARLEEIFTELSYGRIARQLSQDTGAVPPDELERFISDVQEASDAEAAALLGWYFLRRQDWARADVWFRRSLAWGYSDSAAEGIIRVRLGQDDRAGALALAEKYAGRSAAVERVRREILLRDADALPEERRAALSTAVDSARDPQGALELGWSAYRRNEAETAIDWFHKALDWGDTDAVEGLVLSHAMAGNSQRAQDLIETWSNRRPDLKALLTDIGNSAGRLAAEAAEREDYGTCLTLVRQARAEGTINRGLANQEGWCLLELDRPAEAMRAFETGADLPAVPASLEERLRLDANAGISWAMMRQGMVERALTFIQKAELGDENRRALLAAGLGQMALRAYDAQDWREALRLLRSRNNLMPRDRALTMVEAWALYNAGRRDDARRLFTMLDDQLSTSETREALRIITASTR